MATTTERPTMAAKKPFVMPPLKFVDEVPVTIGRTNTQARLPLGLDEMLEGLKTKKQAPEQLVPLEMWESRGIPKDKITPADCKDRILRALYSWQGKNRETPDAEKMKYTLAFSHQFEGRGDKQKYVGTNIYLVLKPN